MCTVNYDTKSNVPIFRLAPGFTKHRVTSVIYDHSNLSTEEETCICNAARQTILEEDEIIINENFQELFNDKTVSSRHNKTQDLLSEDDRLQVNDGTFKIL